MCTRVSVFVCIFLCVCYISIASMLTRPADLRLALIVPLAALAQPAVLMRGRAAAARRCARLRKGRLMPGAVITQRLAVITSESHSW